jgi:hypothetical protein
MILYLYDQVLKKRLLMDVSTIGFSFHQRKNESKNMNLIFKQVQVYSKSGPDSVVPLYLLND